MPNAFTTHLGLALPIIQGPMTGSDTPALAAAVSEAGGLGMLGCGMRSPAAMAEAAAEVRRRTDRPFGMNLFVQATPTPDDATVQAALQRLAPFYAEFGLVPERPAQWCEDFAAQFEALVAARPAVASFTFGILTAAQVARLQAQFGVQRRQAFHRCLYGGLVGVGRGLRKQVHAKGPVGLLAHGGSGFGHGGG